MPIFETTMNYDDMRRAADDGHVCAICGGPLSVAWDSSKNMYMLRCQDLRHNKITRHDKQYEDRMKGVKMDSMVLVKMNEAQMLARIDKVKFPQDLTPVDKRVLALAARTYGFDPLMGEISIYQGKPYISIDGRYRKAQESGNFKRLSARPATKEEREAWGIPADDLFFKATVETMLGAEFEGWGRVFAAEVSGGKGFKPVEKNPQRMAEKRAEAQALRKAFPIPLPDAEELFTPNVTPMDAGTKTVKLVEATLIAPIVGSTGTEIQKQDNDTSGQVKRPDFNFGAVLTWCASHGKQFNKKWFLDNCGFKESDLDAPAKLEASVANICAFTAWTPITKGE